MSVGSGIAIAGIWIATAIIVVDRRVTGIGMVMTLVMGLVATGWISK